MTETSKPPLKGPEETSQEQARSAIEEAQPSTPGSEETGSEETASEGPSRCGTVAIAGTPNVGKSTLLNTLVGLKVAAVTPKPQTTRVRTRGIVNHPRGQIVFVDTPGVHVAKKALNRYLVDQAMEGLTDVDGVVLMVEPGHHPQRASRGLRVLLRRFMKRRPERLLLAINKIDTMGDRKQLLPAIQAWDEALHPEAIVPICARNGDGVDALLEEVAQGLPQGPHLFPDEMLTDRTERWIAGELIREQLTLLTQQELPYSLAVEIESFQEREDRGDVLIHAKIWVERESQKPIVVGKEGARLKKVGTRARKAITELLGRPAHVKLWVKVASKWTEDPRGLKRVGYE